jgi:AcrR family transcriptional regulator
MSAQAPRKRDKNATRERLLQAAARVFNKSGFDGTDSNRLARAAGYAPGTFYKHFTDKRDCFLQVYEAWVDEEWAQLAALLETEGRVERLARTLVDMVVKMHEDWRGLRSGLRALVATDAVVRRFQRQQRQRQLELLRELRARRGRPGRSRGEDAVLLLAMERSADALADGEIDALDVPPAAVRAALVQMVERHLSA